MTAGFGIRLLLSLVERAAPARLGESLAGDLWEEAMAMAAAQGEFPARLWLLGHGLCCAVHGWRMRSRQWDTLETVSAAGLLFAVPAAAVLALRRFSLTLIPFRDSAEWGAPALACGAVAAAVLAGWTIRLCPPRGRGLAAAICGLLAAALPWLFQARTGAGGHLIFLAGALAGARASSARKQSRSRQGEAIR